MTKHQSVCFFFDTPGFTPFIREQFENVYAQVSAICDVLAVWHAREPIPPADASDKRIVFLNDRQIFQEVEHHKDVSKGIVPGNVDLKMIRAIRERPRYDQYIWFEYDVMWTRSLPDIVERLIEETSNIELATSFIHKWSADNWMWWNTLQPPSGTDIVIPEIAYRAFHPLAVVKRRFMEDYAGQLALGWSGHFEVVMPTLAMQRKASILDLSRAKSPFTRYPQFQAYKVENLDRFTPDFVHPVKSSVQRSEVEIVAAKA